MRKIALVVVMMAGFTNLASAAVLDAAPMVPTSTNGATASGADVKSKIKSIDVDVNKDGKPDRTEYYDENGMMTRIEADTNGDGKPDEWGTVQNGKLVKVAKDSDYDGKPDKWVNY